MIDKNNILLMIKDSVKSTEPDATIILYGSYARGDYSIDSDMDLLILLDKKKVTWNDEKKVKYPLYDIEFNTGLIISPIVLSKIEWETKHSITPFFENIQREGIVL